MPESTTAVEIVGLLNRVGLDDCEHILKAAEQRRHEIQLELAASFKPGDEVEYPASSGIVISVEGEYVGIRHHGVESIYASVHVLASEISLVIE